MSTGSLTGRSGRGTCITGASIPLHTKLSSLKQTVEPTGVHTYIGEVDRMRKARAQARVQAAPAANAQRGLGIAVQSSQRARARALRSSLSWTSAAARCGGPVEAFAPAGIIAFFCTLNAGDRRLIVAFELLVKFAGAEQSTPVGWLPFNMRGQLYSPANGCNHHEVQKC